MYFSILEANATEIKDDVIQNTFPSKVNPLVEPKCEIFSIQLDNPQIKF